MAQTLGITQGAYNRIERESTELKVEDLKKIAQRLEVSMNFLLDEDSKVSLYNSQTGTNHTNIQQAFSKEDRKMLMDMIQSQKSQLEQMYNLVERFLSK